MTTASDIDLETSHAMRPRHLLIAAAPIVFTLVFWVSAVGGPVVDPILISIAVAFTVAAGVMAFGNRIGAAVFVAVPFVLVFSPSGQELSFSLAAYDSAFWRWHAVVAGLSAGVAAVSALVMLVPSLRDRSIAMVAAVAALGGLAVLGALMIGRPTTYGDDLDAAARAELPVIDMVSYAYENLPAELEAGETWTAVVRNPDDLPHTLTLEQVDVDLYVPAGREAVVEFTMPERDLIVICTVGDHADLGMVDTVAAG